MEALQQAKEQHDLMLKQTRGQIIKEYDELERQKREFAQHKRDFELYREREQALIESVKQMYHKKIEVFMFITDILEKYNLQPSQLRDAVETHLSRTNHPPEDPSSRSSIGSINLNTNNNMINLNFNLNVAAKS
jgi:hypothetical protein